MSDDKREPVDRQSGPEGLAAIPGVVKVAASAAWHTTEWTADLSLRATRRLVRVALDPGEAGDLVRDIRDATRDVAREIIGVADIEERVRSAVPDTDVARKVAQAIPGGERALRVVESVPASEVARRVVEAVPSGNRNSGPAGEGRRGRGGGDNALPPLRVRGEDLLYRSRDVRYEEDTHPAYERLLDSLSPDEARLLRLMLLDGPQPAVDIRTGGPLGLISSRLLAPGCNMIGARAGLRYVERTPEYLQNLNRLGLIWFSRETLRDPLKYQVLEAQPDVLAAIHSVRQAKVVRRSIHLTPFGEGFCRASLMPGEERVEDLPEHAAPKTRDPQPPDPDPDSDPEPGAEPTDEPEAAG
jgi:hypothetical protein